MTEDTGLADRMLSAELVQEETLSCFWTHFQVIESISLDLRKALGEESGFLVLEETQNLVKCVQRNRTQERRVCSVVRAVWSKRRSDGGLVLPYCEKDEAGRVLAWMVRAGILPSAIRGVPITSPLETHTPPLHRGACMCIHRYTHVGIGLTSL